MFATPNRAGHRIVLIGGLVALALAIVVAGMSPGSAILGSNGVRPQAFVAVLPGGKMLCQSANELPRTTGYLAMTIGTYGRTGPPLQAQLRDEQGTLLARGGLRAGWKEGRMSLPLHGSIASDVSSARLCLANRGRHDIAVGGSVTSRKVAARIGRRAAEGRISMRYVSSRRQSHLARAGTVVDAMANGPGLWGQTAPWVVLALAALAVTAAVRTLW